MKHAAAGLPSVLSGCLFSIRGQSSRDGADRRATEGPLGQGV